MVHYRITHKDFIHTVKNITTDQCDLRLQMIICHITLMQEIWYMQREDVSAFWGLVYLSAPLKDK